MNPRARRELQSYLAVFSRHGLTPPRVTSTDRSPSEQGELVRTRGGVPNSKHLHGLAADIVPGASWRGITLAQLANNVRAWLPHVEAFPHGPTNRADHVHIEWPWGY